MNSNDCLRAIKAHPRKVEVSYKGISTFGVYEETATEIFDGGIRRVAEKKLTVVTEFFPTINKSSDPTLLINGNPLKIQDHYSNDPFRTTVVLQ